MISICLTTLTCSTELEEAEEFTEAYLVCVDALPPIDPRGSLEDRMEEFEQIVECATRVDPDICQLLQQIGEPSYIRDLRRVYTVETGLA